MKVLIAIPCLLNGGTERQTLNLARSLLDDVAHKEFSQCGASKAGVAVTKRYLVEILCYFEYDDKIVEEFRAAGAAICLLGMSRNNGRINIICRLWKEFKRIKPDAVHVQYISPGALAIIAARLAGIKRVYATVHQPWMNSYGKISKLILRTASMMTTRFMAVSCNAEQSWFGSSWLFNEKIPLNYQSHHFTIHNSVDTGRISEISGSTIGESMKLSLNISENITVIGAVSRLRYEKGIDLLISAFALLIHSGINAYLIIVGSGPDEVKLKEQVSSLGLSSVVIIYGNAEWETAIRLMSIMDIVVVPSRFEGFGLTAAEAMAAGKPVVASNTSGLKEVVEDNKTGVLFDVGDRMSLYSSVLGLISNQNRRDDMGKMGKQRAIAYFDQETFRKKIIALYNQ